MVSSYLICDVCGRFGPPAGFLNQDGLRLCYQCWYQERQGEEPDVPGDRAPASGRDTGPASGRDTGPEHR
ncbi:MAG: hypothetical protein RKO24_11075 [Candidatus Competibacter sp.]|nr:hypothetical protein [Candidatus Competibacter sp.]